MQDAFRNKWPLLLLTGFILIALTSACGPASTCITAGGSTTVQPLAEKWAEEFKTKSPNVDVIVQGGGSSAAVKGVAQGIFDIGTASRELKSSETSQWPDLVTYHVALDAIAIVVHPSNTTANLNLKELRDIFATGSNATWTVLNREEGSGTRDNFEEKVMGNTEVSLNSEFLPAAGAIKQKVANTTSAISYISLGYVDASVKALTIDGTTCTKDNCRNGSYPISRYLNFITKGEPGGLVKTFIDFCLSSEGQKLVEEEGYISAK